MRKNTKHMLTYFTFYDKKRVCAVLNTRTRDVTLCAIECGFSAITERIGQESRFLYARDAGTTRRVRNSKVPPSTGIATTSLMRSPGNANRGRSQEHRRRSGEISTERPLQPALMRSFRKSEDGGRRLWDGSSSSAFGQRQEVPRE